MHRYPLNIPISTAVIVGLLISSLVFIGVKHLEEQKLKQEFNNITLNIAKDFEKEINTQLYTLKSIATFFETAEFVDRYDFYTLVTPLYKRSSAFQAIEWIPIVPFEERNHYESFAISDGFPGFRFIEKSPKGAFIPAEKKEVYYPVFYLEPYQGNEAALGFDLGSESTRLSAINEALKSNAASASSPVSLIQGDYSKPATLVFVPISKKAKTSPDKKNKVSGFILGVIKLDLLLDGISPDKYRRSSEFKHINITLFENNDDMSRTFITSKNYPKENVSPAGNTKKYTIRNTQEIKFADKSWQIVIASNHYQYFFLPNLKPLFASGISVLFFITLIAHLISIMKQKDRAEENLEIKTASLISSEQSLQAIVENMADGLITINKEGVIESFNSTAEKIFGHTSEQIIGKNVSILMPEQFQSEQSHYLQQLSKPGREKIIDVGREVGGLKSDGTLVSIDLSLSEININNKPIFVGIFRDITERKKLEKMKNEFISTVSHELRTPLTSIRGALSIIINKSEDNFSDKTKKMLSTAEKNSKRLGELINDILDMEKLDAGMLSFRKDVLNANTVAKAAFEAGEGYAKKHNIMLSIKLHPSNDLMIWGDERRLLQVCANLLSNAIKFSPENSPVKIEVSSIENVVRFTVFDHGEGVSESFRSQLFERFSQADSSDTRQRGGTGLGLNISRAIIEKHKGKIDFYRTTDKQTAFYFEVPIYSEKQENKEHL
ncbi:MAG: CHASE domain-containing protein [Pseudomonadales bacterium]|nr:CHASE domain-containing protein [Pseudomonadales bacterium]